METLRGKGRPRIHEIYQRQGCIKFNIIKGVINLASGVDKEKMHDIHANKEKRKEWRAAFQNAVWLVNVPTNDIWIVSGQVTERWSLQFVLLVGFLKSSSTTKLCRGRAPRLTILRDATHETERGEHDFCLSRSHYNGTDPTSRERVAPAGI